MAFEHKIVSDDTPRLLAKRLDELTEERWKVVACWGVAEGLGGEPWSYALLQRHNPEPDDEEEEANA